MNSKSQKTTYKFKILETKEKYYAQLFIDESGSSLKELIASSSFYYYTINTNPSNDSGYTISISRNLPDQDNYRIRFFNRKNNHINFNHELDKIFKNIMIDFSSTFKINKVDILVNKILKKILLYQNFI